MGEILKSTYATKPEQLTQLQAGPISILTGYNLRKPAKPTSSNEHTNPHPCWYGLLEHVGDKHPF